MGLYTPGNLCKQISPFILFHNPAQSTEPQGQATGKRKGREELLGGSRLGAEDQRSGSEVVHVQTLLNTLPQHTDCVQPLSLPLMLAHGVHCSLICPCEKRGHGSTGASGFCTPPKETLLATALETTTMQALYGHKALC